jgi:acyl carrier protein
MMNDVQRKVLDTIQAKTGRIPSLEQTWWEMEVDSLTMAEITQELESLFEIHFDDRVLDTENVDDLVQLVDEIRASRREAESAEKPGARRDDNRGEAGSAE